MKGQGKQEWGHVNNARNGGQQQQVPSGLSDDVLRGRDKLQMGARALRSLWVTREIVG